jgi:Ca2+-binding EF-hand superfamily protein
MKHRILMTALAAGLVGIGSAHAKPMHDADQLFDALDADGNGSLSQPELSNMRQAMAKLRFESADTNGDGQIDKDEFMAKSEERAERMFEHMDANGDGHLDANEARPPHHGKRDGDHAKHTKDNAKRGDLFKKMDSDGDGSVSREEFDQAMQKHRDRMKPDHDEHAQ